MVLLLIGTSWLFVLSLIIGLCVAARDGDIQQDLSRSFEARESARSGRDATVLAVTQLEYVMPDDSQIRRAPTAADRLTAVS